MNYKTDVEGSPKTPLKINLFLTQIPLKMGGKGTPKTSKETTNRRSHFR
jgi:hypothetical protein